MKGCWNTQTGIFSYICWMNYFDECRLPYCNKFPAHFAQLLDRQQPINHNMHLFPTFVLVLNWVNAETFPSYVWCHCSIFNVFMKHHCKYGNNLINLVLFDFLLSREANIKLISNHVIRFFIGWSSFCNNTFKKSHSIDNWLVVKCLDE